MQHGVVHCNMKLPDVECIVIAYRMVVWLQVYNLLDGSDGFFTNSIHADYRSHTAIPFR